jgi:putative intracellular protease/amidase
MMKFVKNKAYLLIALILILANSAFGQTPPKTVAIVLYNGVQIIDFTGPYEVLGIEFKVVTVAAKAGVITTTEDMKVVPDYTVENCPSPDIIVIPGGNGSQEFKEAKEEPQLIKWIQEKTKTAEVVMSVCSGAFLLQQAKLLDGLELTTTANYIDTLQSLVPSAHVVRNKRFTDNGKIVTTAGLSSGIDGALHVVGKVYGKGWPPIFARFLEYNWNPNSKYTAAALADCNVYDLMNFFYYKMVIDPVTYFGDTRQWKTEFVVRSEESWDSLFAKINKEIVLSEHWTLKRSDAAAGISTWSFTGENKNKWVGELRVKPTAKPGESNVVIKINRI